MIDHVYVSVTNVQKSLAFYAEAFEPRGRQLFGNYGAASGPDGVPGAAMPTMIEPITPADPPPARPPTIGLRP